MTNIEPRSRHTASPSQGVRIERLSGRPLHRTQAGRLALPLWVLNDGKHIGDGALVMTQDEATALYLELREQIADALPSPNNREADTT